MNREIIERTWAPLTTGLVPEPLDPKIRLALASHIRLTHEGDTVTKIDLGGKIAALGDSAEATTALLAQLDGSRTLDEVAIALGWDLVDTVDAAQDLYHLAVVENVGDTIVPAYPFFKHVTTLGRGVMARLSEDISHVGHFIKTLTSGRPTRRLVLGYLVEMYHIIIRASLHIAPTINIAPNERLRMMLCEYLADEYWHGLWLKKGLNAAGLTDEEIERADPLPCTLAAIDHLRVAASNDLLAYAACISTAEGEGKDDIERHMHRFAQLQATSNLSAETVNPFRDHEIADCIAGHFSFVAEMFADAPPINRQRQDLIRREMLAYIRCLEEQHLEIERFYGDSEDGPALYTTAWSPRRTPPPNQTIRLADVKKDFFVYDCGELDGYRKEHLPGAIWLDYAAITKRAFPDDPLATLVFYAADEEHCEIAANRARQLGYKNVFVMTARSPAH